MRIEYDLNTEYQRQSHVKDPLYFPCLLLLLCSYLSCFFYAEKSLLMIAELPIPDTMFGQIFQMTNYLFGALFMSIFLAQVVILSYFYLVFYFFAFYSFISSDVVFFVFCFLFFFKFAARHQGNQT